jgi:predicted polyphosphate/ATP-dependent NAD kinase
VSVPDTASRRLGLIVNPYAGRGGPLARRGSDDLEPIGPPSCAVRDRTLRALRRIAARAHRLEVPLQVLAAPGVMGSRYVGEAGLEHGMRLDSDGPSTPAATRRSAAQAVDAGVDLLLFAGGDGTARDVVGVTGTKLPILGIPAGVKMQSGVFGSTPEAAGEAAVDFLTDPDPVRLIVAEVLDVDETMLRAGGIDTRLYGEACVPRAPRRVLVAKAAAPAADDGRLAAACRAVADELDGDRLTLVGPGTTTARVTAALALPGTLLGVDAIVGGHLVGRDLDEAGLLELLRADPRPVGLVLGVIGGQGMLLGRGNQQLSAAVLRRVSREDITVLAARDKLLALDPARLRVDTSDVELDARLHGYLPVRVAPRERVMMAVGA